MKTWIPGLFILLKAALGLTSIDSYQRMSIDFYRRSRIVARLYLPMLVRTIVSVALRDHRLFPPAGRGK